MDLKLVPIRAHTVFLYLEILQINMTFELQVVCAITKIGVIHDHKLLCFCNEHKDLVRMSDTN